MKISDFEVSGSLLFDLEIPTLERLILLDAELMIHSWSKKSWLESHKVKSHLVILLQKDEKITGAILGRYNQECGIFDLDKIFIDRGYQSLGLGKKLILHLPTIINQVYGPCVKGIDVFLEVSNENTVAINFYQKTGFSIVREVRKFYSDGTGAIIFKKMMSF